MGVLIAGCGYVGSRLASELVEAGQEVFALSRGPGASLPGVTWLQADLRQRESLRDIPGGVTGMVYAASADERTDEAYHQAYVLGLTNLLRSPALQGSPEARLLFVSSTAVYGQDTDEWVDEASPTEPPSFSGRRLLEAEAIAREAGGTVLRLGGIYGPGRTSLVRSVASGNAQYDPARAQYTNRIHRDDCAGALAHLLQLDDPASCYVGVDNEPAPRKEVLSWLAQELGAPAPQAAVSQAPEPGRRAAGSKRCRNTRLRESGYRFRYPTFREGYAPLVEEFGGSPI